MFDESTKPELIRLFAESIRRRNEWNDRFSYWERPESTTETEQLERARRMVQCSLENDLALIVEDVRYVPQGSFTNRTNVRGEADIDIRIQHPLKRLAFGPTVQPNLAFLMGNYTDTQRSFFEIGRGLRDAILENLERDFGAANIDDSGTKAIKVRAVQGSRAEVDVVPCFTLDQVFATGLLGNLTVQGIAILGTDGSWTFNYPDQHIHNGRQKRERTGHRFKKVVRIVKRLQFDLEDQIDGYVRVPSFLIECLVYLVEDSYFVVSTDDRFDRLVRILRRLQQILSDDRSCLELKEINGIKPLFGAGQSWTIADARQFVAQALSHLGYA
ncbi:hypothetical protein J7444_06270 [Labrenzia sp. R4_1]|uniref:hypothetical protein n=1 Tax=Labrenzia sp. R4_1 TaxID=2821106 RepID=UPI001ADB14A1|nr:hypothetical protein [Labrenzia sp. R4_1]MBO9424317.1 hypothetical protein [Labrenzia sp. R4_1]